MQAGEEKGLKSRLLVALGNPGPRYARTPHNVGFMLADRLLTRYSSGSKKSKVKGDLFELAFGGRSVYLLKPMTFMNLSGPPVQQLMAQFKIRPEEIMVFHDEVDLPPAVVRLKCGGGLAGHNGLRSIAACIGKSFARLRLGIGKSPDMKMSDHVLGARPESYYEELLTTGLDAIEKSLDLGPRLAMNEVNRL